MTGMTEDELAELRAEDKEALEDLQARLPHASREELEAAFLDAVAGFVGHAVPSDRITPVDAVIASVGSGYLQNAKLPQALNRRRRLLGLWP